MDLELRELTRAFHASPGDHDLRERYLRLQRRVGAHPHYAVLSCVHANLEAFEAVLRHAQSAGIETLICLGDLVGLGPDPTLVIDRARQRCSICLRGDHDQALIDGPDSDIEANPELRWLRELLKPRLISSPETRRRWRWLKELPLTHRHAGAMFAVRPDVLDLGALASWRQ